MSEIETLRHVLLNTPTGAIGEDQRDSVEWALAEAWHELRGGDKESMAGDKILNRTEDLKWEPPILSFVIERHGGTVFGSTRAVLHGWQVNVQTGEALMGPAPRAYRQLRPRAAVVSVGPLVDEVVRAIEARLFHPAIVWVAPNRVRVTAAKIDALRSNIKQTAEGRRSRFLNALDVAMAAAGWHGKRGKYERDRG